MAGVPGAAQYEEMIALAIQAYNTALGHFNEQRSNLLQEYGYLGSVDPKTGVMTNLRVNPHNPYGLYQQMLRKGAQESEQYAQDAAARGLRGGLANQGQTKAKFDFGGASSTLGSNFQKSIQGIQEGQDQAYFQEQNQIVQAQLAAALAAIASQGYGGGGAPADTSGITNPDDLAKASSTPPVAPGNYVFPSDTSLWTQFKVQPPTPAPGTYVFPSNTSLWTQFKT